SGASSDALVTAGAERPAAVPFGGTGPGEQDSADVGTHSGVVPRPVEFVHGVWAERVAYLRPVEGDTDGVLAAATHRRTMVGDVGEVEPRHSVPRGGVEQLGNSFICHLCENRTCADKCGHETVERSMNPSTAEARVLVDELVRNNVGHVVACPGSRNAALLLALRDTAAAGELTLHVRVDERSAGFLALGIAARTGQPVVLVCTSGTAAANFH